VAGRGQPYLQPGRDDLIMLVRQGPEQTDGLLGIGPVEQRLRIGVPPAATDLTSAELPAGRAVQVVHAGSYEMLPDAYAALGAWFGTHRMRPPDIMWEEYLTGPGAVAESEYRTRVVYPVR
jgi:effector-binding domain-containing protein